ncbi:MAG: hypothetical protein C0459_08660 [Chitinophaga sp.]|nr:hypothetical protein [Chitinophaga sp.]
MKSIPIFKSDKPQKYRLNVAETNTAIKYAVLNVDNRTLEFYNQNDTLLSTTVLKPNEVKFLSVDPLSKKYPELTPYQFASNTPIQAVDLDGKEAFFIHGTATGPQSWSTKLTNFVVKNLTNNIHSDATFSWESRNGYLNNETSRKNAAFDLVTHIIDYRQKNNITNEEITLIGHSHGGNVAIQAAHYLNDIYGITVNIVNFNTPAYNGSKDPENPQVGYGINQLVHYWTKQDGVAGGLAGDDKYNDGVRTDVTNVELNNPLKKDPLRSHYQENINLDELKTKLKKPDPILPSQANPQKNKYDPNWKPPVINNNNSVKPPTGVIND